MRHPRSGLGHRRCEQDTSVDAETRRSRIALLPGHRRGRRPVSGGRTLNVAQSAVSPLLAALEAKLDVPLVERHARGVTLMAAGHRLHQHARAIIAALAK